MKVVILAAGIGSRLGEIAKNTPKCLIELGGKTILERNLDLFLKQGIKKQDIIIVIGDKGEVWAEENKNKIRKMGAKVIINEKNIEKNQAYSFWLAVKDITEDIICVDGDMLLHEKAIRRLLEDKHSSGFLTRKGDPSENRRRVLTENNRVLKIGKEVQADRIYMPILKFGTVFLEALKKEILSDQEIYFSNSIEIPINNICSANPIYNVQLEDKGEDARNLMVHINTSEEYQKAMQMFQKEKSRNFIVIMFGYTAVGKSTIAKKIAGNLPNTEIFHSAVVRKELDLTPKNIEEADKLFDYRNNLREQMDRKVYGELAGRAERALAGGKNVVLDAGFFFQWQRKLIYDKVRHLDPEIFIVKVICKDENEIKRRLEDRKQKFKDSPLNETPSWNTYLVTKKITESVEKEIEENNIKVLEYDTLSKLFTSQIKNDSLNINEIIKSLT